MKKWLIIITVLIIGLAVFGIYSLFSCTDGCGVSPGLTLKCEINDDCKYIENPPIPGKPGCYNLKVQGSYYINTSKQCECINNICKEAYENLALNTTGLTPHKVAENWWKSIFTGDWKIVFGSTVEANKTTTKLGVRVENYLYPSEDCQNKLREVFKNFVGSNYSLEIENTTKLCTYITSGSLIVGIDVDNESCVAITYSYDVTNEQLHWGRNVENQYMTLVKVNEMWKILIDCSQTKIEAITKPI